MVTSRERREGAVVYFPGEAGLFETTAHLIGLGHRAIGHLGWRTRADGERFAGYGRALTEYGLEVDRRRIVFIPRVSIEAGRLAARQLFEQAPEVTGISCYNDLMAIGALQACAELGRRVPQDVAVVGFDDIPLASLVTPALTTMHVPRYKLGEMVMCLLLQVMTTEGPYDEQLYVQPQLVIRESCGACGRGDASFSSPVKLKGRR